METKTNNSAIVEISIDILILKYLAQPNYRILDWQGKPCVELLNWLYENVGHTVTRAKLWSIGKGWRIFCRDDGLVFVEFDNHEHAILLKLSDLAAVNFK